MAAFITHYDILEAWGGKLHALCFTLDVTMMIKSERGTRNAAPFRKWILLWVVEYKGKKTWVFHCERT